MQGRFAREVPMTMMSRRGPESSIIRLFEEMMNDPFFAGREPAMLAPHAGGTLAGRADVAGFLPVDVSEDEKAVIVRASLPGFTKEQIDVQVHDDVLAIRAEATQEQEQSGERFHRRERRHTSVSRTLQLPVPVTGEQTQASLQDGVLTLRLPKSPGRQPRRIEIR
jgi:HSP20 family protein